MFKRTNGYVLLTLLVLTGFAGRVTNETLHSKERRLLINSLKDTRTELLASVKGLSARQLDYRAAKGAPSIRELLQQIVAEEKAFSAQAERAQNTPIDGAARTSLSDAELATQLAKSCPAPLFAGKATSTKKDLEETLELFKVERAQAIKYIRTTTQDVRSFTTPTPSGRADVYQLYLALCAHQAQHNRQIREIMQSTGFPKK